MNRLMRAVVRHLLLREKTASVCTCFSRSSPDNSETKEDMNPTVYPNSWAAAAWGINEEVTYAESVSSSKAPTDITLISWFGDLQM